MSVDRTTYLFYGFKFTEKNDIRVINKHYDELMEEKPYSENFNNSSSEQAIVYDYMCGEYVYIGIKLAKINEYDEDSIELNHEELYGLKDKLFECMKKWPDYLRDLCKDKFPKMYFFIHAY